MAQEPQHEFLDSNGNLLGALYVNADGGIATEHTESGNEAVVDGNGLTVPAVNTDQTQHGSNPAETISGTGASLQFTGDDTRDIHDSADVSLSNSSGASVTEDVTVDYYQGIDNTGTLLASETQSVSLADAGSTTITYLTADFALDNVDYYIEVTTTDLTTDGIDEHTLGAEYTTQQTSQGTLVTTDQNGRERKRVDATSNTTSFPSVDVNEVNKSVQWADAEDDGAGIQDAIDRIGTGTGAIALQPGAVYTISSTLTVDVTNVRGIIGNGAVLEVDSDITALNILGNVIDGGGSPGGSHNEREEQWPYVENLHIRGPDQNPYIGTGIDIENTFGTVVRGCALYHLDTGIAWTNYNRNAAIYDNSIWECSEKLIHFKPTHNIHQLVIANNHLHFARIGIHDEGDELINMNFVGNGMEFYGANQQSTPENALLLESTTFGGESQFIGNWFQAHSSMTSPFIQTTTEWGEHILMSSNYFSNSPSGGIDVVSSTSTFNASDNTFDRMGGTCIRLRGDPESIEVTNNEALDCDNGFFILDSTQSNIISGNISGNAGKDFAGPFIDVVPPSSFHIGMTCTNNSVHYDSGKNGAAYAISVDGGTAELRNANVSGNTVRGRTDVSTGIFVGGDTLNGIISKDNIVQSTGTPFDLPDDTPTDIIVADNISH